MDQTALNVVIGWCDGYQRGHVRGWAWYPRQPHETVTVELLVDGHVVAEASACVARPDLKTAGIGHGRHAFAIPFIVPPDAPAALRVTVRAKDGPILRDGEFGIHTTAEEHDLRTRRGSPAHLEAVFGLLASDEPPANHPTHPAAKPTVNFILYCASGVAEVAAKLGTADYSYLFVMRGFREVLRRLGTVHVVANPAREVDAIHAACRNRQEECFFLSFAPPHATTLGLVCPTIPVIAWEFGTIPTAIWDDEPRHDWRSVLRQCGRAIAISGYAADVIARTMGPKFSVAGIPTPVWDRLAAMRARIAPMPPRDSDPIAIDGFVWDSRTAPVWLEMPLPPIPAAAARPAPSKASLRDWRPALAASGAVAREAAARLQQEADIAAAHAHAAALAQREADEQASRLAQAEADAQEAARALIHAEDLARAEAARPKTLRHRAGLTRRIALQWYREVARDALPLPVAKGMSAAGRLAWQARATLAPQQPPAIVPAAPDVPAAPPTPEPLPPPQAAPPATTYAPTLRWLPAPDDPPLPEPALAVFSPDPYPPPASTQTDRRALLTLDGIVFTAVLAPKDGRKNWQDLLSAFVFAFQHIPDATLVFKMIGADAAFWWWEFHDIVTRLPAFVCRVVVLHGYLDDGMYQQLIGATHFVANASLAEGQCLPLVEFMCGGRPAVAPAHTAMADYITAENAIIVGGDLEYCSWPHDPRNELVATRYRMDWTSLRNAFGQAYSIVTTDPDRYCAMGAAAAATMQTYCGDTTVAAALEDILCLRAPAAAPTGAMAA